jgi:hypothetical protein
MTAQPEYYDEYDGLHEHGTITDMHEDLNAEMLQRL